MVPGFSNIVESRKVNETVSLADTVISLHTSSYISSLGRGVLQTNSIQKSFNLAKFSFSRDGGRGVIQTNSNPEYQVVTKFSFFTPDQLISKVLSPDQIFVGGWGVLQTNISEILE